MFPLVPVAWMLSKLLSAEITPAETHRFGERNCAICSKPLLCYRKTEELHLTVCEKSSTYLQEYRMHILPFDELLLICSCIFVVERYDSYSVRAVTRVLTRRKPHHPQTFPFSSLGNGLLPGIPSWFDSSFLPMFDFLKTLESLDFPNAPTSTVIKQ